jgi:hypothetical protein
VAPASAFWFTGAFCVEVCDWPVLAGSVEDCFWASDCVVSLLFPAAADEPELEVWLELSPVDTFVGDWVDVALEVAVCSVGALCSIVCDWPPESPACVTVALWETELSFVAEEEALDSLVCSAAESARAIPGATAAHAATKTTQAADARARVRMLRRSRTRPRGNRPHVSGSNPPAWVANRARRITMLARCRTICRRS